VTVGDRRLTFRVSGKLWNRSLVMNDVETGSERSHILGRCMAGPLAGRVLDVRPAEMTTWKDWRSRHPSTTVLDLSRASRRYVRAVHDGGERFVLGAVGDGETAAWSFRRLAETRVVFDTLGEIPVVVTFDPESSRATLFSRRWGDILLDLEVDAETGALRGPASGSVFDPDTGRGAGGAHDGAKLEMRPAIVSYRRIWAVFHPASRFADQAPSEYPAARVSGWSLVVVAARTVDVAVLEFLFRRLADVHDRDVEVERDTGQRVIRIQGDLVSLDVGDPHDQRAVLGLGLELHSDLELFHGQLLPIHDLDHRVTPFAVTHRRQEAHLERVAGDPALQFGLEARNDVARTVQVGHRIPAARAVDDVLVVVRERVVDGRDAVSFDLHGGPSALGSRCFPDAAGGVGYREAFPASPSFPPTRPRSSAEGQGYGPESAPVPCRALPCRQLLLSLSVSERR
jgi:hypothetical protein